MRKASGSAAGGGDPSALWERQSTAGNISAQRRKRAASRHEGLSSAVAEPIREAEAPAAEPPAGTVDEMTAATSRDAARAHLTPTMRQLSSFDNPVLDALESRAIRLVSTKWFLAQPKGYQIQRRQALEALERTGATPSPFLTPAQAVTLICRGVRAAGVLTYGWLS